MFMFMLVSGWQWETVACKEMSQNSKQIICELFEKTEQNKCKLWLKQLQMGCTDLLSKLCLTRQLVC